MRVLFLSDFHMGSPLFKHDNRVKSLLHNGYDTIIIVGDIIDSWEDSVWDIVEKHQGLINAINALNNVIIIKGNHDPGVAELNMIFPNAFVMPEYDLEFEDSVIKIIHGHEFDDLILKYYWAAKLFFPFHWVMSRLGFDFKGWIGRLFHSISAKIQDKQYHDLVYAIETRAVDTYKSNYMAVVMGHTHAPKVVEDDCTYVNVGDWVTHSTYVIFEDGKFLLKGEY